MLFICNGPEEGPLKVVMVMALGIKTYTKGLSRGKEVEDMVYSKS